MLNIPEGLDEQDFYKLVGSMNLIPKSILHKKRFHPDQKMTADSSLNAIKDYFKSGQGKSGNGITDFEINKGMKQYKIKNFAGTFMSDNLYKLPKNKKTFSFIMNLDNSKQSGSHWIAVNVTPDTLEYYDPLYNKKIRKGFLTKIKKVLLRNGITKPLKLKENLVRDQRINSDSCGYYSMKFLLDRHKGKSFSVASGYKGIDKAEKAIGLFRKKFNKFI